MDRGHPLNTGSESPSEIAAKSRRRWERHAYSATLRVYEVNARGEPQPGYACEAFDVSRGGVGFRSRKMLNTGTPVLIEAPGIEKPRLLSGVVKSARYAEGRGYVIGVEFGPPPESEAVQAWLSEHGHA